MNALCKAAAIATVITILGSLAGCAENASPQAGKPAAPAKLEGQPVKEAELATVVLTPEAENRLGIRIEEAQDSTAAETRRLSGEVIEPIGRSFAVSSPVAGRLERADNAPLAVGSFLRKDQPVFQLKPLVATSRDMEITAQAELDQARTRLEAARLRKARADRMLADEVGTVRAVEDAQQEVELAMTDVATAEMRFKQIQSAPLDSDVTMVVRAPEDGILRGIHAAPGQSLSAGAPLFEVADLRSVWIRVPVYAGEAPSIVANGSVTVQSLNGTGPSWTAQPVTAPPSGDPASSTVNLYYAMSNERLRFRPGEKLMVMLRTAVSRQWIRVPSSAVVYDTHGGVWVYESLGSYRYARRRVDLDHTASGVAYLNAGVPAGTKVVIDGTAELWGFEFGTGK